MGSRQFGGYLDSLLPVLPVAQHVFGDGAGWRASSTDESGVAARANLYRAFQLVASLGGKSSGTRRNLQCTAPQPKAYRPLYRGCDSLLGSGDSTQGSSLPFAIRGQVSGSRVPASAGGT